MTKVIIYYNNFILVITWTTGIFSFFLALIAGAMSSKIGNKPLILIPTIGIAMGHFIEMIFFAFRNSIVALKYHVRHMLSCQFCE
jgi:hypothetical protein